MNVQFNLRPQVQHAAEVVVNVGVRSKLSLTRAAPWQAVTQGQPGRDAASSDHDDLLNYPQA